MVTLNSQLLKGKVYVASRTSMDKFASEASQPICAIFSIRMIDSAHQQCACANIVE